MASSLRFQSTVASVLLCALTIAAVVSLGVISTRMTQHTREVWNHLESVHVANRVLDGLQVHRWQRELWDATGDETHAEQAQRAMISVRETLREARSLAVTPEEKGIIDQLSARVEGYLEAPTPDPAEHLRGKTALGERLVQVNLEQARVSMDANQRWDTAANVVSFALAIGMLLAVGLGLWLIRRQLYEPLIELRASLLKFRPGGTRRTPAEEKGVQEIRDIARTFNEVAARLEQQRHRQLSFLSAIAHDIRNPLHALSMAAAARPGHPLPTGEKLQKRFELVNRQVSRLSRMVDDLMDTTRIEAGELSLHLADHDLVALCKEAVELHRTSTDKHHWVVDLPSEPVLIRCDATRIAQVLNNLLSNAIKYSPEGGLIRVGITDEDDSAIVAVTDQGIGIAATERESIFEPFRRTASTRASIPGVGLGLSVARRIIEAHGGSITVRSEPLHGSTFRFRLPRAMVSERGEPLQHTEAPNAVH